MRQKSYLPCKKNNNLQHKRNQYPAHTNNQRNVPATVFTGNIVNNMRFGEKGDMRSGYVRRELITRDSSGNIQIAREEQFFNSGKGIRVRIGEGNRSKR